MLPKTSVLITQSLDTAYSSSFCLNNVHKSIIFYLFCSGFSKTRKGRRESLMEKFYFSQMLKMGKVHSAKFRTSKLHLECFFPPLVPEMRKCQEQHKIWWIGVSRASKSLKSSCPRTYKPESLRCF